MLNIPNKDGVLKEGDVISVGHLLARDERAPRLLVKLGNFEDSRLQKGIPQKLIGNYFFLQDLITGLLKDRLREATVVAATHSNKTMQLILMAGSFTISL